MLASDDMAVHEVVHIPRSAVYSKGTVGHHRLWGDESFALRESPKETVGIDTAHHAQSVEGGALYRAVMVSAIHKVIGVNLSELVCRRMRREEEAGVMSV